LSWPDKFDGRILAEFCKIEPENDLTHFLLIFAENHRNLLLLSQLSMTFDMENFNFKPIKRVFQ
jgi:hypothetical protein